METCGSQATNRHPTSLRDLSSSGKMCSGAVCRDAQQAHHTATLPHHCTHHSLTTAHTHTPSPLHTPTHSLTTAHTHSPTTAHTTPSPLHTHTPSPQHTHTHSSSAATPQGSTSLYLEEDLARVDTEGQHGATDEDRVEDSSSHVSKV